VPAWFGAPRGGEGGLRDILERYDVGDWLARILAVNVGLDLEDARNVAERATAAFARKAEKGGRWRDFCHLDPERHRVYCNTPYAIQVADIPRRSVEVYTMGDDDYAIGLALLVLEEKLPSIAQYLSREGDVQEVEGRLRGVLEGLNSMPRNAVRSGFVRLLFLPPRLDEALRRELLKYSEGAFQSRELAEAWRGTIRREDSGYMYLFHVFKAYLVGRGAGYTLPEGFKAYERGHFVLMIGKTSLGWEVGCFAIGDDRWEQVDSTPLPREELQALEDLIVGDFKSGHAPFKILKGVEAAAALHFAHYGYPKLAREVYRMVRDFRAYARVEVGGRGAGPVIHIVRDPDDGHARPDFLFVVDYGGRRHLMDRWLIEIALSHEKVGKLELTKPEYRMVVARCMELDYRCLDRLAGAVAKMLNNPKVRAELPGDILSWMEREYTQVRGRHGRHRGIQSASTS